ncbi:MAG: hypothetical protein KHW81_17920 [[Clostridium] innocuum]|nr:hypothetical protein [[Clostridium] innocuum]MBS5686242.1 hypothetical protein [[Clostridium] innocuum]
MQSLNNFISIIVPSAITVVSIIGGLIGSKIISISSDKDALKEKILSKTSELNITKNQIDKLFSEIYEEESNDFIKDKYNEVEEDSRLENFIDIDEIDDEALPYHEKKFNDAKAFKCRNYKGLNAAVIKLMEVCKTYNPIVQFADKSSN